MEIRRAGADDLPFLERMWHTAAFWQPEVFSMTPGEAMRVPEIARYIEGWGRKGDVALVATEQDTPLGAVWYRLFTEDQPGYGFVNEHTPEVALAVTEDARGRGVGTQLLHALIEVAREEGRPGLSLSVNATNPSRRIYQRSGFVDVGSDDSDSYVMVLLL